MIEVVQTIFCGGSKEGRVSVSKQFLKKIYRKGSIKIGFEKFYTFLMVRDSL